MTNLLLVRKKFESGRVLDQEPANDLGFEQEFSGKLELLMMKFCSIGYLIEKIGVQQIQMEVHPFHVV